ncbi:MAG: phosphodiester glycosidase family protein [Deltaproteobacteria bacterium]|nr:phosphodiester glycosidase family protein [Deltaproteobacteria bacterium]
MALLTIAVLAAPSLALADDTWTTPYPGVRHLHRLVADHDIHVVMVDLSRSEMSVVATAPDGRRTVTSEFARTNGAVVAVNGNWFGGSTCGLAAGSGQVWPDAYADGCDASIGFGGNRAAAFDSRRIHRGPVPQPWMTDVVTGKPWLVKAGRPQGPWTRPRRMDDRAQRTAIGLTQDGRTLILLVADGRRRDVSGVTGAELVTMLRELGAHDAINLDGGGSSTLFIAAEGGVVNRQRGTHERIVGNHLGIRIRGVAPGPPTPEERDAARRRQQREIRERRERATQGFNPATFPVLPNPAPPSIARGKPRRRSA